MAVKQKRRARGRPPASTSDAEDTRRSLLDAAARLIAERGYGATTVNAIVARAGLSKGSFYWHFKSKDDALFAVLEEHVDRPLHELLSDAAAAVSAHHARAAVVGAVAVETPHARKK